MTSKNMLWQWLCRAAVTVTAVCVGFAGWSWLPSARSAEPFLLMSLPMTLAVLVMMPAMFAALGVRLGPAGRDGRAGGSQDPRAMLLVMRWFLAGAPGWAKALWALLLAATFAVMVLGLLRGGADPADHMRMFTALAVYFGFTATLMYRALLRTGPPEISRR